MTSIQTQMITMATECRQETEDFEFVDGEYPANQEESEFDETGESLPDKDGILLNDWIDDEEADRLLHLYSKKKIDEI